MEKYNKLEELRANKLQALNQHLMVQDKISKELSLNKYIKDEALKLLEETRNAWQQAELLFKQVAFSK